MPLFIVSRHLLGKDLIFKPDRFGQTRVLIDNLEVGRIVEQPDASGDVQWHWAIHCCLDTAEIIESHGNADTPHEAREALRQAVDDWLDAKETISVRSMLANPGIKLAPLRPRLK